MKFLKHLIFIEILSHPVMQHCIPTNGKTLRSLSNSFNSFSETLICKMIYTEKEKRFK